VRQCETLSEDIQQWAEQEDPGILHHLPVLVIIEHWGQELVFGWSLRKLLDKSAQNALGISVTFLGSIVAEVRQLGFGCWIVEELVNNL